MIPLQTLSQYAEVLGTNTHLKELHMANVRLTDKIAKVIVVLFIQLEFLENVFIFHAVSYYCMLWFFL